MSDDAKNVLGSPLRGCSNDPLTGFYRDGCCNTGPAGAAPRVFLSSTHERTLEIVSLDDLKPYALDLN